jgi:hypothetical protein
VRAAGPTFARRASAGKEVEADDDASIREPVSAQRVAHRPQSHEWIEVLRGDLEPACPPLAERLADPEEVVACRRELVVVPAPVGLGCRLDDTEPFELLEALREQGAGKPRRTLQDLAEASAAKVQVADDQRCPALGEDLGATSDGAVLFLTTPVLRTRLRLKSRFLTLRPAVRGRAGGAYRTFRHTISCPSRRSTKPVTAPDESRWKIRLVRG